VSRLTVGLIGGLASGKSTVARRLAEGGCFVVDADRLVAELYGPGREGARIVGRLAGPGVLRADGSVEKTVLAARLFADAELRQRIEAAIHPLVGTTFRSLAGRAPEPIAVLEATLLAESGLTGAFDVVVTVEAPKEVRLARAVERGLTSAEARARMAAQGSSDLRRAVADVVIENDGSLEQLRRRTTELLETLHRRAETDG
jgi:dephospho-CoA kinase